MQTKFWKKQRLTPEPLVLPLSPDSLFDLSPAGARRYKSSLAVLSGYQSCNYSVGELDE